MTAHTIGPDVDEAPEESVRVRAKVTTPAGDVAYVAGGEVPSWLWNDRDTRETWKRWRRKDILAVVTVDKRPRGYRITWETYDDPWELR